MADTKDKQTSELAPKVCEEASSGKATTDNESSTMNGQSTKAEVTSAEEATIENAAVTVETEEVSTDNSTPVEVKASSSSADVNDVEAKDENRLKDLDDFESKIKEQLNKGDDKEFCENFVKFKEYLNTMDASKETNFQKPCVRSLIDDHYQLISREQSIEVKFEIFHEMVLEVTSYLAKKPTIKLTEEEIEKRKNDIKKVKKEILESDKQIKRLEKKELSLDDLVNEEDNTLVQIGKEKARVIRLYKKLRNLENKYVFFGDDDIDLSDLTENEDFNQVMFKEAQKYKRADILPDYNDVLNVITKFTEQHKGVELDSKDIFEAVCLRLKEYRKEQLLSSFNSYLRNRNHDSIENEPLVETEELKQKLDNQNNFQEKMNELVKVYTEKNPKDVVDDEEGECSTTEDEGAGDNNEIFTISDSEEEFVSKDEKENGLKACADETTTVDDKSSNQSKAEDKKLSTVDNGSRSEDKKPNIAATLNNSKTKSTFNPDNSPQPLSDSTSSDEELEIVYNYLDADVVFDEEESEDKKRARNFKSELIPQTDGTAIFKIKRSTEKKPNDVTGEKPVESKKAEVDKSPTCVENDAGSYTEIRSRNDDEDGDQKNNARSKRKSNGHDKETKKMKVDDEEDDCIFVD